MQDSKESHFDAKKAGGNADVDIRVADFVGRFEGPT